MNKSALKAFATSARKELLKKVEAKAMKIGITEDNIKKAEIESSDAIYIDGKQLSKEEKVQRDRLIERINQIGFKRVMEEVAYTWFNRFTALRYMEVNEYLPTDVSVLSSTNPESADPDMIKEALSLDLEIDKEYVYELKLNNKTEELFKYLIIKHCNDLNRYLPFMFETIDDYTEILFPEGLLAKDSFIREMTNTDIIPENNWRKVEVIGWLYQYYIAEEKDRVIKAKKKYKTEEIPFATQLFTPDWIVRYMVQNSLGRYWIESHPEHRDLLSKWEFYLENPNPEPDFEEKLAPYINKDLNIEDIKCFDPAMGSGHILVYMFDALYEIYSKCGYMEREIPRLIIENNLYGLDIDDRAYQLACFSVVMKALEYNERFFRSIEREGLTLNLVSIKETNMVNDEDIAFIADENDGDKFENTKRFINQFKDAKTIGSLIKLGEFDHVSLESRLEEIRNSLATNLFEEETKRKVLNILPNLLNQYKIMSMKFDILVTNPPYIGRKYINSELGAYLKKYYIRTKSDVFAAFIEYSINMVTKNGHIGLMTPFVWMFITTYEKLRTVIINEKNISSLIQLEYSAFEEATVPICTFTLRNSFTKTTGEYIQLADFVGSKSQPIKTLEAVKNPDVYYRYSSNSEDFSRISGSPIGYWVSGKVRGIFESTKPLSEIAKPKVGMFTSDNARFLRFWHEVNINKIGFGLESREQAQESNLKWFPYNKGGAFRKWYGNNEYVVNWENDGEELKEWGEYLNKVSTPAGRLNNKEYYFKEGITWSDISSSNFGVRYTKKGFLFDISGSSVFPNKQEMYNMLGFLCSKLSFNFLKILNPTMHFQTGNISDLPFKELTNKNHKEIVEQLVLDCINKSQEEWDQFETSWDFKSHPIIGSKEDSVYLLSSALDNIEKLSKIRFNQVKTNEEQLNDIYIKIYELEDEVSSEINDKDITLRKFDREREIKSFLSYAIGCMLGRYSLDQEGLVFAGGEFNSSLYKSYSVDRDNVIPILAETYFEDDIVSRFIDFVQVTFGESTLSENLDFIADTLGKKKGETAKETIRRYFLTDFFKDHVQTYKKRPIYWLFTSGKQKAFNCLIYMHRYDKTTLSRIRTDYLHEYQIRLDAERKSLVSILEGDSTTKEISNAKKELKTLDKKIEELKEYDELFHHMADMQIEIDLDDGVAVNYEKFKGLVAKI
ncbi:BREX-1 system adenine-specific DNA-methyltransferase PglX [Bacillus zhangzhouensis]|uniref:BREX-1 system adenine-specific DNA-methyltransferase PglX n=1 Tax=Bacillus zhangzhouensis TaxID=1178540 RepID=UPI002813EB47|nr:BREX-1 system adenine-specific DNA-methyltransferase PglX [Bacillus zhangzhouensis]MDR0127271.1 BREX-1 system adenine-specific DNA-methyltransferase PglX [Bacillus zhangzhouensis]